jgi:hypothetical protein
VIWHNISAAVIASMDECVFAPVIWIIYRMPNPMLAKPFNPAVCSQQQLVNRGVFVILKKFINNLLNFRALMPFCHKNENVGLIFNIFETSEIAIRNLPALARSKKAISERAQEHASGFSPTVLDISIL